MDRLPEERRRAIVSMARESKTIRVRELSRRLDISDRTVRRDLEELELQGLIRRTRGGAVWVGSDPSWDRSFDLRRDSLSAEKARIGERAASMVKEGQVLILDAGTTTLKCAQFLLDKTELLVITISVDIATVLCEAKGVTTLLSGGILRQSTRSLVGPKAEEFFADIRADLLFLGVSGVSAKRGLTNSNPYETGVKKAMISSAREVVVLADNTKIGNDAMECFAPLESIHCLITDDRAPEAELRAIEERGVKVIVV